MKKTERLNQLLTLVACFLLVASLAIVSQSKLFGKDLVADSPKKSAPIDNDTLRTLADGSVVVNTSGLASDVRGFAGKVPLEITIKDNKVKDIKALDNAESQEFFNRASTLFDSWRGKSVDEARNLKVDAVSGATFSSRAIIGNVQRGLDYVSQQSGHGQDGGVLGSFDCSVKNIAGLAVVLLAAILPLFVKSKKYHIVQLLLNVVVLGFWCGACLSYASLLGVVANGVDVVAMVIFVVMLVSAFISPLLGRKSHYCTHVCPYGSAQQLAGMCVKYKVKIGPVALRRLGIFRQVLWALLMLCLWGGVWSEWIGCEPFAAFVFRSSSWAAIVIAVVFIGLSFVVTRPYCRFVCPMGTLLKISESSK